MAKRATAKLVKVAWGAKYINPQSKATTRAERRAMKKAGITVPHALRRWITTGLHASRGEAQSYMAHKHPNAQGVKFYRIRLAARFFDEATQAFLEKVAAKGFQSGNDR